MRPTYIIALTQTTYIESSVIVLALAKRKTLCWLMYERDLQTESRILTLIVKNLSC